MWCKLDYCTVVYSFSLFSVFPLGVLLLPGGCEGAFLPCGVTSTQRPLSSRNTQPSQIPFVSSTSFCQAFKRPGNTVIIKGAIPYPLSYCTLYEADCIFRPPKKERNQQQKRCGFCDHTTTPKSVGILRARSKVQPKTQPHGVRPGLGVVSVRLWGSRVVGEKNATDNQSEGRKEPGCF